MTTEYLAEFRALCAVLPLGEYPRKCPFISDGYRPNLSFFQAEKGDELPTYCVGQVVIPQGQLYAGDEGEVLIRAIIDDAVKTQVVPGTGFDLKEANEVIAHCTVTTVRKLEAIT